LRPWPAQHKGKRGQLPIPGKHLHQHLEVGDEGERLKRQPLLGNARLCRIQLGPERFRAAGLGMEHTRHPGLETPATGLFNQSKHVLEHAARAALAPAEAQGDALLYVASLARNRLQMISENLEHQPGIACGRELWEMRMRRKCLAADRRARSTRLFSCWLHHFATASGFGRFIRHEINEYELPLPGISACAAQ